MLLSEIVLTMSYIITSPYALQKMKMPLMTGCCNHRNMSFGRVILSLVHVRADIMSYESTMCVLHAITCNRSGEQEATCAVKWILTILSPVTRSEHEPPRCLISMYPVVIWRKLVLPILLHNSIFVLAGFCSCEVELVLAPLFFLVSVGWHIAPIFHCSTQMSSTADTDGVW